MKRVAFAIVFLLLLPCPTQAAIAADVGSDGVYCLSCTSLSWSHTVTAVSPYPVLVVQVWQETLTESNFTGCTYNSVAMTKAGTGLSNNGGTSFAYYLFGPATGSHTITCSAGTTNIVGVAGSFTGVDPGGLDVAAHGETKCLGTNTCSQATTTATDNAWLVSCVFHYSNITAGTGSTNLITGGSNNSSAVFYNGPISPAASTSMTVNAGSASNDYTQWQLAFKPYSATTSTCTRMLLGLGPCDEDAR